MYVSSILWRFKSGTRDRVAQVLEEQILPAVRQVPGLRHVYVAPTDADTWLSVLLYDSETQAQQGMATLVPIVRQSMGDTVEGMERHAGEVTLEAHPREH